MGQWRPGWGVIHTGGPGIITEVADKLDLTLHDARHSTASLHEVGNLGGVAVLDVLARTHSDPPVDGADGLLVGFGPGFVTAACRGTWRSEPALAPFGMRIPGPGA
jgi:predicted naringenin-chalcone synthase